MPTIQPEPSEDFATLMGWAEAIRDMKVRANAETVADASMARRFGAEGIGLSRTEHMFFEADRIGAMRRVIMAEDETGRRAGLAELSGRSRWKTRRGTRTTPRYSPISTPNSTAFLTTIGKLCVWH